MHLGGISQAIQNEVRILAALDHENIVEYRSAFAHEGCADSAHPYRAVLTRRFHADPMRIPTHRVLSIVMEYADGGTLADAIESQRLLGDAPFSSAMVRSLVLTASPPSHLG